MQVRVVVVMGWEEDEDWQHDADEGLEGEVGCPEEGAVDVEVVVGLDELDGQDGRDVVLG